MVAQYHLMIRLDGRQSLTSEVGPSLASQSKSLDALRFHLLHLQWTTTDATKSKSLTVHMDPRSLRQLTRSWLTTTLVHRGVIKETRPSNYLFTHNGAHSPSPSPTSSAFGVWSTTSRGTEQTGTVDSMETDLIQSRVAEQSRGLGTFMGGLAEPCSRGGSSNTLCAHRGRCVVHAVLFRDITSIEYTLSTSRIEGLFS